MNSKKIEYYRYSKAINGYIDAFRGWIKYHTQKNGAELKGFEVRDTENKRDLVMRVCSNDTDILNIIIQNFHRYVKLERGKMESENFVINFETNVKINKDCVEFTVSFFFPNELLDAKKEVEEEIRRMRESQNQYSHILDEL